MRVAVLMGGTTSEREISLRTGRGMAQAVRRLGHEVLAVDVATGRLLAPGEEERAAAPGKALEIAGPAALLSGSALREAEVVLIALHGGSGENGTLQALLDLAGKPYTGSGVMASALAMNKAVSKRVFEQAGVATPPWTLAPAEGLMAALLRTGAVPAQVRKLGLPLVVKPNEEGSTFGLTIVRDWTAIHAAFVEAARYGYEILFEQFIEGRELTVAVLGEQALPIVEIRPKSGLYDYESKYTAGRSDYFCPADLPEPLAEQIRDLGLRASRALDCRGVTRVDFRLDPQNQPWCLEVNTIPGMTPTSLVPMAAKAAGFSYEQVVQRMLDMALEEARRRRRVAPAKA
jgi:D-alanine-D-alanine ligase